MQEGNGLKTKIKDFIPQSMDPEQRDCLICNAPNKICDMDQCDKCKLWAHYSCAGVTEEVQKHDWSCAKCVSTLHVPKLRKAGKIIAKRQLPRRVIVNLLTWEMIEHWSIP